jgi:hypothetical protein
LSTILAIGLAACAHGPAQVIRATTYLEHYRPTPLDYLRVPREGFGLSPSATLIAAGASQLRLLGHEAEFVAALRTPKCHDVCYFYRSAGVDDLYLVVTIDSRQTMLRKWFTFSPLDDGSG